MEKIFYISIPTWGRCPICLIFFRWVETTNKTRWFYKFQSIYLSIYSLISYIHLQYLPGTLWWPLFWLEAFDLVLQKNTKIEDIHGVTGIYIYILIPHYHIVITRIQNCIMSQKHQITAKTTHTHKTKNIYNNLLKIPSCRRCQPSSQEWFKGVVARTAPFGAFVTVTLEGGEQADGLVHVSKIKALLTRNDLKKKEGAIFLGWTPKNNKKNGRNKK